MTWELDSWGELGGSDRLGALLREDAPAVSELPVAGAALWLDTLRTGALWADVARTTPASEGAAVASFFDPTTAIAAERSALSERPVVTGGWVVHDGANDSLVITPALPVHTWSGITVFGVLQTGSSIPSYQTLIGINQSGVVRWSLGANNDASFRHGWAGVASGVALNSPVITTPVNTAMVIAWRKDVAQWKIWRNLTAGSAIADTSWPTAAPTIWIGAEPVGSGAFYLNGRHRTAPLIYPSALSDSEITTMIEWLAARHGVTL